MARADEVREYLAALPRGWFGEYAVREDRKSDHHIDNRKSGLYTGTRRRR
jgi:hypothetical protein